jgi:flavin-dependent dehydrogenase
MSQPSDDVVVVGGGPAGSMLAGQLAQAGVPVIVLDQSSFPRPKPCGGGLSEKAVRLLGPALDRPSIIEDRCSELRSSWRGETPDRQLLWEFFTGGIFRQGPPDPHAPK